MDEWILARSPHALGTLSGINTERSGLLPPLVWESSVRVCVHVCVHAHARQCVSVCVHAHLQLLPDSDWITYKQAYANLAESVFQQNSPHNFPNSFDLAKSKNKIKLPSTPIFCSACLWSLVPCSSHEVRMFGMSLQRLLICLSPLHTLLPLTRPSSCPLPDAWCSGLWPRAPLVWALSHSAFWVSSSRMSVDVILLTKGLRAFSFWFQESHRPQGRRCSNVTNLWTLSRQCGVGWYHLTWFLDTRMCKLPSTAISHVSRSSYKWIYETLIYQIRG